MFPLAWVAVLAIFFLALIGLKLLADYKQNVNTFMASLVAIVVLIVTEITAIPYLTPNSAYLVELVDVGTVVLAIVAIFLIYYRRFPKIDLEQAQKLAINNLKPKYKKAWIDITRKSYLDGKKWIIPVNFQINPNFPSLSSWIVIDARTGEIIT